jgi:hypothetical protein
MDDGTEAVQFKADADVRLPVDLEAVNAAEQGHQWGWNLLVDRLGPDLWALVRADGLADHEAAEVFRLTWMRAADRLDDLSAVSIRSWLEEAAERDRLRIVGLR